MQLALYLKKLQKETSNIAFGDTPKQSCYYTAVHKL